MPHPEQFWDTVQDQAKGMNRDEFFGGWRSVDQESPEGLIRDTFEFADRTSHAPDQPMNGDGHLDHFEFHRVYDMLRE